MAHNQEMLSKNKGKWGNDVKVIGINIDENKEDLINHVKEKKWTSIDHYFKGPSLCDEELHVRGIPHAVLVDKSGKIVFMGAPAERPDLEEDIGKLLKGREIQVEAGEDEGDEEEEDDDEGFAECDADKIHREMDGFTGLARRL